MLTFHVQFIFIFLNDHLFNDIRNQFKYKNKQINKNK